MQRIFTITGNLLAETTSRFNMTGIGQTMRAIGTSTFQVGGKGVNVAKTATSIGVKCSAVVFPAGHIGKRCLEYLSKEAFDVIAISIDGETREGLVCVDSNGVQTTFLGSDLPIPEDAFELCLCKLAEQIKQGDVLALCGSFPNWQRKYAKKLSDLCKNKNVYFCVDTYGTPLTDIANVHCNLLKFNKTELSTFLASMKENINLPTAELFKIARSKYFANAEIFAITDGANDIFVSDKTTTFTISPMQIPQEVSATGCGDALFAVAISEIFFKNTPLQKSFERASKYASMTAQLETTSVLPPEEIDTALA